MDSTRASRDGHEYQDVWAARLATRLLHASISKFTGSKKLVGVTVEGFSSADSAHLSPEAKEIADIVLYYGDNEILNFKEVKKIDVVQLKYSIANAKKEFRAYDAKSIIEKFSKVYSDFINKYNNNEVNKKLHFEIVTNRPIYKNFSDAIKKIANNEPHANTDTQVEQFKRASHLSGDDIIEFAKNIKITSTKQMLSESDGHLSKTLINWDSYCDASASIHLENLKSLVRQKAGGRAENNNAIMITDVLAALGIDRMENFFPCTSSLVNIENVIKRDRFDDAINLILESNNPILIHAASGVGKTVFLESLANELTDNHEVVFFDCFAGGRYRSLTDKRHKIQRGLVHIANDLASRGLCDLLLPGNDDEANTMKAFIERLVQASRHLQSLNPSKNLIIFLDAIDNAKIQADDEGDKSFPEELLKNLNFDNIPGLKIIFSTRTNRKPEINIDFKELKLLNFTREELRNYLNFKSPNFVESDLSVLLARSNGNPRVLEYFLGDKSNTEIDENSDDEIKLEEIIKRRIKSALNIANEQGYQKSKISMLLTGLSVLPLPVPVDDFCCLLEMSKSELESFVIDMRPILENTREGIMLRDEPTETFIREEYGKIKTNLTNLARNLQFNQENSVYAATVLPMMLYRMNKGDQLLNLAFSKEFPTGDDVGKNIIRYERIITAIKYAIKENNTTQLASLLVEMSAVAVNNQSSNQYILDAPDMVAAFGDANMKRKLIDLRTEWPGTRHARLAIIYALSNNLGEALMNARSVHHWFMHHIKQPAENQNSRDNYGPEWIDIASIPFTYILQNEYEKAAKYALQWKGDIQAHSLHEELFKLIKQSIPVSSAPHVDIKNYLINITDSVGGLVAAICLLDINSEDKKIFITQLAKICKTGKSIGSNSYKGREPESFVDNLYKVSGIAVDLKLYKEAKVILKLLPKKYIKLYDFDHPMIKSDAFYWLTKIALTACSDQQKVIFKNLLPEKIFILSKGIKNDLSKNEFVECVKMKIDKFSLKDFEFGKNKNVKEKYLTREEQWRAQKFIKDIFPFLLKTANCLVDVFNSRGQKATTHFSDMLDFFKKNIDYRYISSEIRFKHDLAFRIIIYVLCSKQNLKIELLENASRYFQICENILSAHDKMQIIEIFSKYSGMHSYACREAVGSMKLIEEENETKNKSNMYLNLARVIMPINMDEGIEYFQKGLYSLNTIGTGDYEYTDALLLFTDSLKNFELCEKDFHNFMSIYEVSLQDSESTKFDWANFSKVLSQISGNKGLLRLITWDAKSFISLKYTLSPYLAFLAKNKKILLKDAIALNRLVDPANFHFFDINNWASIIAESQEKDVNKKELIKELLKQHSENVGRFFASERFADFMSVSEEILGEDAEFVKYLKTYNKKNKKCSIENRKNEGYEYKANKKTSQFVYNKNRSTKSRMKTIAKAVDPMSPLSLEEAIRKFFKLDHNVYSFRDLFFEEISKNLKPRDYRKYIENISRLENLDLHSKINELTRCKEKWVNLFVTLPKLYDEMSTLIVNMNAKDFLDNYTLSRYRLKLLSEVSDVPINLLALKFIKSISKSNLQIPGSAWLELATLVSDMSDVKCSGSALARLLNSDITKISDKIPKKEWNQVLSNNAKDCDVYAKIIWHMLGSHDARDRWRAAHCMRTFARLGRWSVIDAIVNLLSENANQEIASGIKFYLLNAKLWAIIGLTRISLDYPKKVTSYKKTLLSFALNDKFPHALIKHFSSLCIKNCTNSGALKLRKDEIKRLDAINRTALKYIKLKTNGGAKIKKYSRKKNKENFNFGIDFDIYINGLARAFGINNNDIKQLISHYVHKIDPNAESIYQRDARNIRSEVFERTDLNSRNIIYGEYLAWHALFMGAEELLKKNPIVHKKDSCPPYDDRWHEWLSDYYLSREDGMWISDGLDNPPIFACTNLLEYERDVRRVTGSKSKILDLIGLKNGLKNSLVVDGMWRSADDISVYISSSLIEPKNVESTIEEIIKERPIGIGLPHYDHEDEDEQYVMHSYIDAVKKCIPWIVCPDKEAKLDRHDPLGSIYTNRRPRILNKYASLLSLKPSDTFDSQWTGNNKRIFAHTYAWEQMKQYERDSNDYALTLSCSKGLIKKLLLKSKLDLIILIKLEKYEKDNGGYKGKFFNTVSVVHINNMLQLKYHKGKINHEN